MPLSRLFLPPGALRAALICALAIGYFSLVPFEYRPRSFDEAWAIFRRVPYLELGIGDRADWIANLLAYMPLGFFLVAGLQGGHTRSRLLPAAMAIGLAGLLAVAVEFTQIFFAPRTVSQNDLIAELLGATVGAVSWFPLRDRVDGWSRALTTGGERARLAVLAAYAVGYLALSLFPYDFVASASELAWKLESGKSGLLFAPGQCDAAGPCTLRLAAEALAFAPLGVLWAARRGGSVSVWAALALGGLLGIAIEGGQFLLAGGISQGASVITRAVGFAAGAIGFGVFRAVGLETLVRWGRAATGLLLLPYLFVVAFAAGWPGQGPLSVEQAVARWPEFRLLPFYYHYFVPEAHALASTVAHAALYAPIGVAGWLWLRWHPGGAALAAVLAGALAFAAELSKAFLPGRHPDFTDVLIAGVSAWAVFAALHLATRAEKTRPSAPFSAAKPGPSAERGASSVRAEPASVVARGVAILALWAIVAWSVTELPMLRLPLTAALLAYAALLVWRPQAWLVVLPALLPVLDLAPWTGRFFWDEFDLFVLVTLAVRLATRPPAREPGQAMATFAWPAVVLACAVASAVIGLLPLDRLDANAFSSYYSHYNALRALKGVAWAGALFLVMRADATAGLDALGLLGKGFVAALGTAAIAIVWERATFTGLFDATENYRITGLFSSMHVGGAYAESFLLAALPFALCAALFSRSLSARLGIAALAAVGCYALAATFSRSAYVAFAVELVVLVGVLLTTRRAMRPGTQRLASSTSVGTVAVLALLVAVPIAIGPFATSRFAGIAKDAPARLNQWEEAAGLFEVRPTTVLLGMGLGRFPERYLWGGPAEGRPGTHRFETEDANTFLRLGAGQPLYFDQFVPVSRQSTYTFSFDTRQSEPGATLAVALCEKFILYSSRCIWVEVLRDRATGRGWVRFEQRVDTQDLGAGAWPLGRPVKLSLTNSGRTGHVDVDNVSLIRADGTETIANGSFSAGMDHWLFTADDFWPWHIENLFLHTFFEQGLVGLVVLLALVAVGSGRLLSARRVDGLQAAFLSAIAGLLAMGTLNTVINAPRPALVFFLLLFAGLLAPYQREARAGEA